MDLFINPNSKGPNEVPASSPKEGAKQNHEVRLLDNVKQLSRRIQRDWNLLTPSELAEQIVELEDRVSLLKGTSSEIEKIRKVAEHFHFQFVFPIVSEFESTPVEGGIPYSSFAKTVYQVAKRIFEKQSPELLKQLNSMQIDEVIRIAGTGGNMSPEILSHAMKKYVEALRHQVAVAEAFFFGRVAEGMEGLLSLPADVQRKIDQLIWDAAGGGAIDPTEKRFQPLIAAAIMRSVEERMGIEDSL